MVVRSHAQDTPGVESIRGHLVPIWMPTVFRPTEEMKLFGVELAVAAYIFCTDHDPKEELVQNPHCCGDRNALMTLVPTKPLVDDVLTLVASMLSHKSSRMKWFLPPTFTQFALGKIPQSNGTLSWIRNTYMGKVDYMCMIYIPICIGFHWFLLIVDNIKHQLVYLDSLKSHQHRRERILAIKEVAIFIERMILDASWYENTATPRPAISDYPIYEPMVPQQDRGSNDCGVWVAQWMVLSYLWKDHKVEGVNSETRMRLAVDLVLKEHNPNRNAIIKLAIDSWVKKRRATHSIN